MKDPAVEQLVEDFYTKVAELNTIWASLINEGVYIGTSVEGDYAVNSLKQLVVDRIEQTVSYKQENYKVLAKRKTR